MTLTVGKGPNAKVVPKRVSLKDRAAIQRINNRRKAKGQAPLKGTEDLALPLSPEQEAQEKVDKELLESRGYVNASPEVIARIKEEEAAKKALGSEYVSRVGDRYYEIKEDKTPARTPAMNISGVQQVPGVQTNTGNLGPPPSSIGPASNERLPTPLERLQRGQGAEVLAQASQSDNRFIRAVAGIGSGVKETGETAVLTTGKLALSVGEYLSGPHPLLRESYEDPTKVPSLVGDKLKSGFSAGYDFLGGALPAAGAAIARNPSYELPKLATEVFAPEAALRGLEIAPKVVRAAERGAEATGNVLESEVRKATGVLPEDKAGAVFRNGKRVSPTSRVQLRKQSLNQAYNPNVYRTGSSVVERTPRNVKALEMLQGGTLRATQVKVVKTGEGTLVAARTSYIRPEGSPRVAEPNRVLAVIPKGGSERAVVKFTQGKKGQPLSNGDLVSGNVRFSSGGDVKSSQLYSRPSSQVSVPNDVQGVVLQNVVSPQNVVKNPFREPSFVSEPYKPNVSSVPGSVTPQYELSPNVNVPKSAFSPDARTIPRRGGFRVRPSGRPVFSRPTKDVEVVVDIQEALPSSPVKSIISVKRNPLFSIEPIGKNDLVPVSKSEEIIVVAEKVDQSASSGLKVSPAVISDQNQESITSLTFKSKLLPALVQRSGQSAAQAVSSVQSVEISQVQEQVQDQVYDFSKLDVKLPRPIVPVVVEDRNKIALPSLNTSPIQEPSRITRPLRPGEKILLKWPSPPEVKRLVVPPSSGKKVPQSLFKVVVGSPGNKVYRDLGIGGADLVKKGVNLAKGTAAASVRVIPVSKGSSVRSVRSLFGNEFSLNRKGVFVQKNQYRISSAGEKREIPGESVRSRRLTKGSRFGKALDLSKKGFSLRAIRRRFS